MREIEFKYIWMNRDTKEYKTQLFTLTQIQNGKVLKYWEDIGLVTYELIDRQQFLFSHDNQEFFEGDLVDQTIKGCFVEEKEQQITYVDHLAQFRFGTFVINDLVEIKKVGNKYV